LPSIEIPAAYPRRADDRYHRNDVGYRNNPNYSKSASLPSDI